MAVTTNPFLVVPNISQEGKDTLQRFASNVVKDLKNINVNGLRHTKTVPATPTSHGLRGDWTFTGTLVYLCVDTNTWVRWTVVTSW